MIPNQVQVALDSRILKEYVNVLARPRLGILPSNAQAVLSYITITGLWVKAIPLIFNFANIPDPNDLPFAEVVVASQALALVTGNERHYPYLARYGVGILSPAKFLRKFE